MDQVAARPLVVDFDDPSDAAAALRDASVEYLSQAPGRYAARMTMIDAGPAVIQAMSDGAHLTRGVIAPGRACLLFAVDHMPERPSVNGALVATDDIVVLGPGAPVLSEMTTPGRWAAVTFDIEELADAAWVPSSAGFRPCLLAGHVRAELALRVDELSRIAAADPARLVGSGVRGAIADTLQHLAGEVMRSGGRDEGASRALNRRVRLVAEAEDLMAARIGEPVYSADIHAALGVPMRTLHDAFVAVRGMSMHRYLRLHRLNLARQSLRSAGPGASQVKAAALRYGFWHLGRFAQEYRALFGELPSDTAGRNHRDG